MKQCTNENPSCLGSKPGRLTGVENQTLMLKKKTVYLKGRRVANEEVSATGHPPAIRVQAKPI